MRAGIWPARRAIWFSLALLSVSAAAQAFDSGAANGTQPMAAQGTLQVAFTPGDDIEGLIAETLDKARKQVLMQAYILTSKPLTNALIAARKRGVDVRVLVDADQLNKSGRERIADLQRAGIKVLQETKYKNAHNKVIVIDAGNADATVITGSYNFTWTAQNKNAENILVARKNPPLAAKYAANWMRHFQEAEAYQ
ncbi:endonuclease [Herbaspirillum sp. meg3]|uniref:phospholipase D family nuclease n=1 Tax=Herbaspirillum sp. meg3 TaxID=2025949 RepID=UPI000B97EEE3|nr:phospholipase D family protein [Herbaspirillum sp. meg3]ASU40053.1 endonuclease [Herbaspirillum sp. meg3]